jgi:hypothetical protein
MVSCITLWVKHGDNEETKHLLLETVTKRLLKTAEKTYACAAANC